MVLETTVKKETLTFWYFQLFTFFLHLLRKTVKLQQLQGGFKHIAPFLSCLSDNTEGTQRGPNRLLLVPKHIVKAARSWITTLFIWCLWGTVTGEHLPPHGIRGSAGGSESSGVSGPGHHTELLTHNLLTFFSTFSAICRQVHLPPFYCSHSQARCFYYETNGAGKQGTVVIKCLNEYYVRR